MNYNQYLEVFKKTWHDRKKRSIMLLSIFTVILTLTIIIRLFSSEPKPPEGTFKVAICQVCEFKECRRIKNIKNPKYKCSKCGGQLAKVWKCMECEYEYPFLQSKISKKGLTKPELFRRLAQLRKCPKCGSVRTRAVSPRKYLDRQKKKTIAE